MPEIFESTDSELVAAAATFASVANSNSTILSLSPGDITAISAASTTYGTGYGAMVTARDASKAATQVKSNNRKALLALYRTYAKKFYANPAVPSNLIAALGLPVHEGGRTPVVPVPPADLVAVGESNGDNGLKWKRNGNAGSVVFLLEESLDGAVWSLFGMTKKTKFTHTDQVPGTTKYYRVRGSANGIISSPSNSAVVYPLGLGAELHLAA